MASFDLHLLRQSPSTSRHRRTCSRLRPADWVRSDSRANCWRPPSRAPGKPGVDPQAIDGCPDRPGRPSSPRGSPGPPPGYSPIFASTTVSPRFIVVNGLDRLRAGRTVSASWKSDLSHHGAARLSRRQRVSDDCSTAPNRNWPTSSTAWAPPARPRTKEPSSTTLTPARRRGRALGSQHQLPFPGPPPPITGWSSSGSAN